MKPDIHQTRLGITDYIEPVAPFEAGACHADFLHRLLCSMWHYKKMADGLREFLLVQSTFERSIVKMKVSNKNQFARASAMRASNAPLGRLALIAGAVAALNGLAIAPAAAHDRFTFDMVRSPGIVSAGCVPDAAATVTIRKRGPVEEMKVEVRGLPPKTGFDFFVIQVPNAPFGMSWYQGDIETDENGNAHQVFIGRFNEETFIVAPGPAPAPVIHNGGLTPQTSSSHGFPDANTNPQTAPVHTYHLGLWFNDFKAADHAGCPSTVTPFNGEHQAGVQVLNTSQFPDLEGPLLKVKP